MARRHSRVAIGLGVASEASVLSLSRMRDAFPNGKRFFFRALARNIAILNRRHFNMQIDSVEQRTGNPLAITLHLDWTATAFAFEIAKVSAWAGIHRRHEHEFAGKSQTAGRARDRHFSVFERLPHHFQRRAFEFRKLVEK